MEVFNHNLYKSLSGEDKEIINEYRSKLNVSEINTFMERLSYHAAEVLEVKEDADVVEVYENIFPANKRYKDLVRYFIIRRFANYFVGKNGKNNKLLHKAVKKYLNTFDDMMDFDLINRRIQDICVELTENSIHINTILPMRLYTRKKNVKQLGIALDKVAISSSGYKLEEYGHNFKIHNVGILMDDIKLSSFIDRCGFWFPKNAKQHGFNKKTGIIWLNGRQQDEQWYFDDKTHCAINNFVNVKLTITTDAFSKMLYRFNFAQKLREAKNLFDKTH